MNLFRTLHQGATFSGPDSPIDDSFVRPLLINLAAFTLVYLAFTSTRARLARTEDDLEQAEAIADLALAGSGVTEPNLDKGAFDD